MRAHTGILLPLLIASGVSAVLRLDVSAAVAPQTQPTRDNRAAPGGTASIRGRVLDADTHSPLRRVEIRLVAPELREDRATFTDPQGRYEFHGLPTGRYSVWAAKRGYVTMIYGRRHSAEQGRPLDLQNATALDNIDFALTLGAVITGRIVDEYGDPAVDVEVSLWRYRFMEGRRVLLPTGGSGHTDDLGDYRMSGFAAGQYYLSATIPGFGGGVMESSNDRSASLPTYFPGTANIADARALTVRGGATINNVNMALVVARIAHVSGMVLDRDGRPVPSGFVSLTRRHGVAAERTSHDAWIRSDGTFTVTGVEPGEYSVETNLPATPATGMPQLATTTVAVAGEDVEGLRLVTGAPARLSGRVVLDSVGPRDRPRGSQFRFVAAVLEPDDGYMRWSGTAAAKDDFTIEMRVQPCQCVVRSIGAANGWVLRSVRLNGTDITDTPIEFRIDQEVSGLEIEMSNQPSVVAGLVTTADGRAARDYTVVVFSRDRQRWNPPSRYIDSGRPDQNGRYMIRGLPAGDYYAVALETAEDGQWTDPGFLERVRDKATTMSIADGETKTLDLKLVSGTY